MQTKNITNMKHELADGCKARSALFNICRKALGHLMKFTQRGIPYRFGLAG